MLKTVIALLMLSSAAGDDAALVAKADELYLARGDLAKLREAIDLLEKLAKDDPKLYDARWRLAKDYWYLGKHEADNDKKQELFWKGVEHAKAATEIAPDKPEGFFWLGVSYGVYGEAKGIFKSLSLVNPMKEALEKALSIDKNCECGGPDRVLGRLYYKLPFFKGGSNKKSIEYLKKSLDLCKVNTLTRLYLADTYMSEDMDKEAEEQLNLILSGEADPKYAPETEENKVEAKKLLEKLKD